MNRRAEKTEALKGGGETALISTAPAALTGHNQHVKMDNTHKIPSIIIIIKTQIYKNKYYQAPFAFSKTHLIKYNQMINTLKAELQVLHFSSYKCVYREKLTAEKNPLLWGSFRFLLPPPEGADAHLSRRCLQKNLSLAADSPQDRVF